MSEVLNLSLVGFPNSGKTTLYNWLTGSKFKTVNYPGSTTEFSLGELNPALNQFLSEPKKINVIDTPGVYSFHPKSADEDVTYRIIKSTNQIKTDLVLLVIDSLQLERQLLLAKALLEAKVPFMIVLTMTDLLEKNSRIIHNNKLGEILGNFINAPPIKVLSFEGLLGKGLKEIVHEISTRSQNQFQPDFKTKNNEDYQNDINWVKSVSKQVLVKSKVSTSYQQTQKIDQWLLNPLFGYAFFILSMGFLFASLFWVAQPFMDGIEWVFTQLATVVESNIPNLFGDFLSNGIITAVGGIVIFVPQIFILFALVYVLESSGYLARVAVLIDKPMSYLGLGGRSFVPMLSGFGCAIPAIIATRNISSKSERFLARSLIPLLTCSARIPVFTLLLTFLMRGESFILMGFAMAGLYFLSLIISAIASAIISRFIKDRDESSLLMDLPLYRRPKLSVTFSYALERVKTFLKRAGPIIFVLSIVLWFMTSFPKVEVPTGDNVASHSYAAQLGQAIEPVFKPMGLDWRVGFGLITAFAAREVFVSSLALVFNAEGDDETQTKSLLDKMHEAKFPDGTPVFTLGSSLGLIIFFIIAMQCLATFAILKKESGSFKVAFIQLTLSNLAAYVLAVATNYFFRLI